MKKKLSEKTEGQEPKKSNKMEGFKKEFHKATFEDFLIICNKLIDLFKRQIDSLLEMTIVIKYIPHQLFRVHLSNVSDYYNKMIIIIERVNKKVIANKEDRSEMYAILIKTQNLINRLHDLMLKGY